MSMTEEQKAETAKAKEKADAEFEDSLADLSDEEKVQKRADKNAKELYQSKLDELTDAKKKAEDALAERRFKEAEAKRKAEEGTQDEKPLTKKELDEALAKQSQSVQMTLREQEITQKVKGLTTSDTEASLVLEILSTRTFPSNLTLDQQIRESVAIANADKLVGERDEAFRALRAKETAEMGGQSHHDPIRTSTEPTMKPQDKEAIQRSGFVWNATNKRYEKKLPNGKIMIRDSQTGAVTMSS